MEEPENHLSHSTLNELTKNIIAKCPNKQLIVTTHSNFVANKLGLNYLLLLSNTHTFLLSDMQPEDVRYFSCLPGYDTLRIILSRKTILVEGPSDELIVQRAFKDKYNCLPIECGIDVISVRGLSFKRFLNLAKIVKKKCVVITDNDGNYSDKITEKYKEYREIDHIKIYADIDNTLNTLEPQFVHANQQKLSLLTQVLDIKTAFSEEEITAYMLSHKTEWALCIFNTNEKFEFPTYINEAIEWIYAK